MFFNNSKKKEAQKALEQKAQQTLEAMEANFEAEQAALSLAEYCANNEIDLHSVKYITNRLSIIYQNANNITLGFNCDNNIKVSGYSVSFENK